MAASRTRQTQQRRRRQQDEDARPASIERARERLAAYEANRSERQQPARQQQQEGPKGIFGAILGNPIVQGALSPLQYLTLPGRAVMSGAKEFGDFVGNVTGEEDRPLFGGGMMTDESSWSDFLGQMNDPSFGFGKIIGNATGNKWGDRALGLVGDIASDPLTYLTAGAGRFAGAGGRVALAKQARVAGLGDEAINRLGRFGPSHATDAERALIPTMNEPGLRFAGARIPGTGGAQRALNEARAAVGDRVPIARLAGPGRRAETRPFALSLARGEGGERAAGALLNREYRDLGERVFEGALVREAQNIGQAFRRDSADVIDQIEHGGRVAPRRSGRNSQADPQRFFEEIVPRLAKEQGVDIPMRANYVPHFWTDEGLEALDKLGGSSITTTVKLAGDSDAGRLRGRQLNAGETVMIGDVPVNIADGSIRGITQAIHDAVPELQGVKLLEDDLGTIAARYVRDMAKDVGTMRGLRVLGDDVVDADSLMGTAVDRKGNPILNERASQIQGGALAARPLQGPTPGGPLAGVNDAALAAALRPKVESRLGSVQKAAVNQATADVDAARLANLQTYRSVERTGRLAVPDPARHTAAVNAHKVAAEALQSAKRRLVEVKAQLNKQGQDTTGLQAWADDLEEVLTLPGTKSNPRLEALFVEAQHLLADVAKHDARAAQYDESLAALRSGALTPVFEQQLADGWRLVNENLGMTSGDLAIREEMATAIERVLSGTKDQGFIPLWDGLVNFFKTWATATPGFHVRNGMSATFMNLVAGVSVRNQMQGVGLWRAYVKNPTGDWWLDLPPNVQQVAKDAVEAVYASGAGGQFSRADLLETARGQRGRLARIGDATWDNRLTAKSRFAGEAVEGVVRVGMALDTLLTGGSVVEAAQRISRYHFNYSDLSRVDAVAKRIIPFWTFFSRNLPLQVQSMWLEPRRYVQFNHLMDNVDDDPNDERVMPLWMAEQGARFVGENTVFRPDFGFSRLQEDVAKLADPGRLLNDVHPLLRVPMEFSAGRQFFTGQPFEDGAVEAGDPISTFLAGLTGNTYEAGDGSDVMDQRLEYALRQVPPLALLGRLAGTGRNEGRQTQASLGFLGSPVTTLTERQIEGELLRRQFEDRDRRRRQIDPRIRELAEYGR